MSTSEQKRLKCKLDPVYAEKQREYYRRYWGANHEKIRERQRRYQEANPEKIREQYRVSNLKCRHGISTSAYHDKLIAQAGRCSICKEAFRNQPNNPVVYGAGGDFDLLHPDCMQLISKLSPKWLVQYHAFMKKVATRATRVRCE